MLTSPRWTHVALPSGDLDASIDWYGRYTPLALLDRRGRRRPNGVARPRGPGREPVRPGARHVLPRRRPPAPAAVPFAHLGIEVPTRAEVDRLADQARAEGCLHWEPADIGPPVGYVCALHDPDANVVEISHNQGVHAKVQEVWGG